MTSVVLRPTSGSGSYGGYLVGAANVGAATNDNSDASYVRPSSAWVDLSTVAMPAGAVTRQARTRCRVSNQNTLGGVGRFTISLTKADGTFLSSRTHDLGVGAITVVDSDGSWFPVVLTQAEVDGLRVPFYCQYTNTAFHEIYVDLMYVPLPTCSVSGPSGTLTTVLAPTATWTHTPGSDAPSGQAGYQIKIFNAAQYGAGGFNPDSSVAVWDSGYTAGSATSRTLPTLTNYTSYRCYVRTYQVVEGQSQVSAWSYSSFTISVPAGVPTGVTPANGGTISSSRPTLTGSVLTTGLTARREWQFATNAGFTTGLITITEPVAMLRDNPSGNYTFPTASGRLAQGTWYLRSRSIDSTSATSAWSSTNVFTVSHPPSTTNRTPTGAQSVPYATTRRVDWTFTDPDPADVQLKYQAQLWKLSAPGSPIDTGQVTASSKFHNFTGLDSTWKDTELRWRVQVWDQDNVASGWSTEQAFFMRDPATISVTSPTNLQVINNAAPNITWSFTASAGRTQAQWRITIRNMTTGVDIITSGWQTGAATSWQVPSPVILVGPTYRITLEVVDSVGLTATTTRNFSASYAVPAGPTYSVTSINYSTTGHVFIEWSGATPDANFVAWRVYQRVNSGPWTLIYETTTVTVRLYDDYTAPSGQLVEYAVVQAILNLGNVIETSYNPTSVNEELDHYMLTCPSNPDLNMVLYHVTGESFSDEQEMATVNLLGRGRRVEYGDRYGQTGQLSVTFRDQFNGPTAREQRLALEALRDSGYEVYLLNPFGDVYSVAMMSASIQRVPGRGRQEDATATISYSEITA